MKVTALVLFLFTWTGQAQSPVSSKDEAIWQDFARWTEALQPLPPGSHILLRERYVEHLVAGGLSAEEAGGVFDRVRVLRGGSTDRTSVYWNAAFKLGGGPNNPSRLLQETLRDVEPGRGAGCGHGTRPQQHLSLLHRLGRHRI